MYQQTIAQPVYCSGTGLHSGKTVELVFRPGSENSGIMFAQNENGRPVFLHASPELVINTHLATNLGSNGVRIGTVEHILAAVRGLEIDNIIIEVRGTEIPIMDGSARNFVDLLLQAGVKKQRERKKVYSLHRDILFQENGSMIRAFPSNTFSIHYIIDFPHPLIGKQDFTFQANREDFVCEISRARTFGFLDDVQKLYENGLIKGGSLDNALVFDEYRVLNPEGLRFANEPVRHKILDFIGDLALLPYRLQGSFEVHCSGHDFNNRFARYLENNRDQLLNMTFEEQNIYPNRSYIPAAAHYEMQAKAG